VVEPRLKSKIAVAAMLRMGDAAGKPGAVLKRGDPDAGAILILLRGRNGLAIFGQTRAPDGGEAWQRLSGPMRCWRASSVSIRIYGRWSSKHPICNLHFNFM